MAVWAAETAPEPGKALIEAVIARDLHGVQQALAQGASIETRNHQGRTPLILAAQAGALEIARFLVERGAEVNARSSSETGSTVLSFALEGKSPQLAAFLIDHGADVNGKAKNGQTPLHYAAAYGLNDFLELLLYRGADPNLPSSTGGSSTTPLIAAAANGHLESVRILLDRGADLEKTNSVGNTPLLEVCKHPYPNVVQLLLERGARINAKTPLGHTALIYASCHGHTEVIQQLLDSGADPLATVSEISHGDQRSYDAADIAQQNGHWKALLLILRAQEQALKAKLRRQWDILS